MDDADTVVVVAVAHRPEHHCAKAVAADDDAGLTEIAIVHLVESNGKKAAFLRSALADLSAPARVHAGRIEAMPARIAEPEVVTARALAPLDRLLLLTEPWLTAGATGLFHKGREYMSEVKEASAAWHYDLVKHNSLIDAESVILEVSGLRRR